MFGDTPTDEQTDNQTNNGSGAINTAPGLGLGANPAANDVPQPSAPAPPSTNPTFTPVDDSTDDSTGIGNPPSTTASSSDDDLSKIKSEALDQLSPLVHKLDQNPEEKYKTLMMMIQASDNQDLIREAYDAAQKITDEKAKAEALLNIVNEINYFSQNK